MTKKTIINGMITVFLLTLCVSFNSCQKEGVYNPKQKISKIYTEDSFVEGKFLVQEWTWDKNLLSKIDYWGISSYEGEDIPEIFSTDRFLYEKNRLVEIVHGEGFYSNFSYKGSNYAKMETFDASNTILMTADFTYEKDKISKISIMIKNSEFLGKKMTAKLLSAFLPQELLSRTVQSIETIRNSKGDDDMNIILDYTYNGDNIKEINISQFFQDVDFETSKVAYISYDKKQNPNYQKLEIVVIPEMGIGLVTLVSKNNPLEIVTTIYKDGVAIDARTTTFSYTYEGNFPTEVQQTLSLPGWEMTSKLYYEYK